MHISFHSQVWLFSINALNDLKKNNFLKKIYYKMGFENMSLEQEGDVVFWKIIIISPYDLKKIWANKIKVYYHRYLRWELGTGG